MTRATPDAKKDQTHHFAAYFLVGAMAGDESRAAGMAGAMAQGDTPLANPGDFLLSVVAAELGGGYRAKPSFLGKSITSMLQKAPARSPKGGVLWNAAVGNATIYTTKP